MKSQDIFIRQFSQKDYDKIIELWRNAGLIFRPEGRDSSAKINQQIKNVTTIILVAEFNGKIVGTVLGTHDGRKGWINRLAVDTEFRGRNVAKRLVAELESRFEKIGLEVVACLIEGKNTASMEVFRKLGYEESDVKYFSKRKSWKS
jgi:ribosomal protein S18 acetylase RimI-like enzyme